MATRRPTRQGAILVPNSCLARGNGLHMHVFFYVYTCMLRHVCVCVCVLYVCCFVSVSSFTKKKKRAVNLLGWGRWRRRGRVVQECLVIAFAVVIFSYFYSFSIDHYHSMTYAFLPHVPKMI